MVNIPTVKDLLEAGVHFGHQTKRWNPKMAQYIFTVKNDIHIIDLSKTLETLPAALAFLEEKASDGGDILFVGTKRQAQEVVEEAAKRVGVMYVTNRWVGGLLTNFNITKQSLSKMAMIEEGMVKGFENRTKQEISLMAKELERLQRLYGGVKGLNRKPSVIVLADPHHERLAVKEAQRLQVPIIAIVDTNCNPDDATYMIPGNDDAIGSISLFFNKFVEAIEEGRKTKPVKNEEPQKEAKPVEKSEKKESVKETKTETKKAPKKEEKKEGVKKTKTTVRAAKVTKKTVKE